MEYDLKSYRVVERSRIRRRIALEKLDTEALLPAVFETW